MSKYLMIGIEDCGAKLFSMVSSDRTRGNGHKLKKKKLHLNTRNYFFIVRVVKHWNRLPREIVKTSSLEMLKV